VREPLRDDALVGLSHRIETPAQGFEAAQAHVFDSHAEAPDLAPRTVDGVPENGLAKVRLARTLESEQARVARHVEPIVPMPGVEDEA
jgi:hypothetical protein